VQPSRRASRDSGFTTQVECDSVQNVEKINRICISEIFEAKSSNYGSARRCRRTTSPRRTEFQKEGTVRLCDFAQDSRSIHHLACYLRRVLFTHFGILEKILSQVRFYSFMITNLLSGFCMMMEQQKSMQIEFKLILHKAFSSALFLSLKLSTIKLGRLYVFWKMGEE
jgi:hypothetical protein